MATVPADEDTRKRAVKSFLKLPLRFEANHGQVDARAKFIARGDAYALFLTANEAIFSLSGRTREIILPTGVKRMASKAVVRLTLANGNPAPNIVATDMTPGKKNYLIGSDEANWKTGIPSYAKVEYQGVYDGIDMVYHSKDGGLEYDFVVKPGADPKSIGLEFRGAKKLGLDKKGDLVLITAAGRTTNSKPVAFQELNGVRKPVDCAFRLSKKGLVSFAVGSYEPSATLVIDPQLVHSNYLGDDFQILDIETEDYPIGNPLVDQNGDGMIDGSDLPGIFVEGIPDPSYSSNMPITYTTDQINYIDEGFGVATDPAGNAYVTGYTQSITFPVTSAGIQGTLNNLSDDIQDNEAFDVFVTKIFADGTDFEYSTYIGGANTDEGHDIAVNPANGNAYLTGSTLSQNFPIKNAVRGAGGQQDAFVLELVPTGDDFVFSTFLGGTAVDSGRRVALDPQGGVYVAGSTSSANFPTFNPIQGTFGGVRDGFVTKFAASGQLLYSTFLGGAQDDFAAGIAVDPSGNAYVTGTTQSANFPLATPLDPVLNEDNVSGPGADTDAFVLKINPAGSVLVFSTFLGGKDSDGGVAIGISSRSTPIVTGTTVSNDFPRVNGLLAGYKGGTDGFVTRYNASGSALTFSTYIGGLLEDVPEALTVNSSDYYFVVGSTTSSDFFPIQNPYQTGNAGAQDGFITKFNPSNGIVFSTYLGGEDDQISDVSSYNPFLSSPNLGIFVFERNLPGNEFSRGIAADSVGNFYVSGTTESAIFRFLNAARPETNEPPDAYCVQFNDATPRITNSKVITGQVGTLLTPFQVTSTTDPLNSNQVAFNATGLPQGISINTGTGLITGTPVNSGVTLATVTASQDNNSFGTQELTFFISATAPVIDSPTTAVAVVGEPFVYRITASNLPDSFTAGPLPIGFAVDLRTGEITGIAQGVPPGGFVDVALTATNLIGTGTRSLRIIIIPPKPVITSTDFVRGTAKAPFRYQILATNNPLAYAIPPLPSTQLPMGLTLDGLSGLISGVPDASGGPVVVRIQASNNGGTGFKDLSILIDDAPVITSADAATGVLNTNFTYTITTMAGNPFMVDSFGAVGLPNGLTIDTVTGIISGQPTQAGTFNVTLQATNMSGTGTKSLTLTITLGRPIINSSLDQIATAGENFEYPITAFPLPLSFTATGLPSGLTFNPTTGIIKGTPSFPGPFPSAVNPVLVNISASNNEGTDNKVLSITILPPAPVFPPQTPPVGILNVPYSFTFAATSFDPVTFSATGLPAFFTLNPTTGTITGTPTQVGQIAFSITVTTASMKAATQPYTIQINPPAPVINSILTDTTTEGSAYQYQITATNGPLTAISAVPVSPSTAFPVLGISFDAATGVISGVPTAPGQITITLTATNVTGTSAPATFVLTINPGPPVISSPTTALALVGTPFTYQITASARPTSFNASGLPLGFAIDTATGLISGTAVATGTVTIVLSATNSLGTGVRNLILTIQPPVPAITSPLQAAGTVSVPFSYQITSTPPGTNFTASSLPPGLSLDGSTGVISGTPTTPSPDGSPYLVTIGSTNVSGTGTAILEIIIGSPAARIVNNPLTVVAVQGQLFTYPILVTGIQPITITAVGLPPGLSFAGGVISGVPQLPGSYFVNLTANNAFNATPDAVVLNIRVLGVGDSDGDSAPDELETALGTNPNDANSRPYTDGPEPLSISKLAIKLDFRKRSKDSISIVGSLPLPRNFSAGKAGPTGGGIQIYVGGVLSTLAPLSSKGSTSRDFANSSFRLRVPKFAEASKETSSFSLKLSKGNFSDQLKEEELTEAISVTISNESRVVPVILLLSYTPVGQTTPVKILYRSDKVVSYSARAKSRTGSAKQPR